MDRLFQREHPFHRLRLWTQPDSPAIQRGDDLVLEWAGRVGHPSSYGLLGGHLVDGLTRLDLPYDGDPFPETMAAPEDAAAFGLPAEYRRAVTSAVPYGLAVSVAAHGRVSSSDSVFARLTRTLDALLRAEGSSTDEEIWRTFDESASPQRQPTNPS